VPEMSCEKMVVGAKVLPEVRVPEMLCDKMVVGAKEAGQRRCGGDRRQGRQLRHGDGGREGILGLGFLSV